MAKRQKSRGMWPIKFAEWLMPIIGVGVAILSGLALLQGKFEMAVGGFTCAALALVWGWMLWRLEKDPDKPWYPTIKGAAEAATGFLWFIGPVLWYIGLAATLIGLYPIAYDIYHGYPPDIDVLIIGMLVAAVGMGLVRSLREDERPHYRKQGQHIIGAIIIAAGIALAVGSIVYLMVYTQTQPTDTSISYYYINDVNSITLFPSNPSPSPAVYFVTCVVGWIGLVAVGFGLGYLWPRKYAEAKDTGAKHGK